MAGSVYQLAGGVEAEASWGSRVKRESVIGFNSYCNFSRESGDIIFEFKSHTGEILWLIYEFKNLQKFWLNIRRVSYPETGFSLKRLLPPNR